MADLAATDVTVTVQQSLLQGRQRRNRVKIVFGDAALTYPSGGVPIGTSLANAALKCGMKRNLDNLFLGDADDATGIVWKYDAETAKLRAYIMGVNLSAAGAGTLDDYPIDNTADPLASASVSIGLVGGAAGVKHIGKLTELTAAASAPPATVIYGEAIGW